MSITRAINIDGKEVKFCASASIPRIYRTKFQRDIYKDLQALEKGIKSDEMLDTFSLELFENIAYIMAKHADAALPETPEEWLDNFSTFSIYRVLPEIIELWGLNTKTDITSKKNNVQQTVR